MKFGQYELRELIAVGGMAEVYKGRVVGAEGFEKHVAIKRILPDLAEDERFVKMLLTEARIHSALSHRNIVQIHDLGISEDGEYFIVLEYVEGYDLRMVLDQLTEQGRILPEALSLHIASELAQGLHFAHEQRGADRQPLGLVHRDVSPSNVLISMSGEIKLSDFGLAKRRHDRSVVGSLKGNLAYMSPEQARQSRLDRRTDVFSLGAVLFEMLTGKRLREIRDEIAAWNHVASGQVPLLRAVRPDLSEPLERLLARALAPEPEGRFADAAIFGSAIRGVLLSLNTPVGATDLQHLLSTLQPARRPRALVPERSKVIRLGPEAQALGEAIAAPLTPLPASAPGMTASPPRAPGGITNLSDVDVHAGRTEPRNGVGESDMATPPPVEPLAPVRGTPRAPIPTARADRITPPRSLQTSYVDRAPPRLHSPASAAAVPFASLTWGGVAAAAAVPVAIEGRPATGEHLPTIPSSSTSSQSLAAASRPRRDTARVVVRGGAAWRPIVVALAATLLLVAGAVHLAVVPLDVLVVWRKPATLAIMTVPQGAMAELDGTMLPGRTPTQTTVRRDRFNHVLELSAPGHRTVRQTLRYDGAVSLSVSARLEKDAGPTFEPLPSATAPAPVPRAPDVGGESPSVAAKTTAPAAPAAKPSKAAKGGARRQKNARGKRAARGRSHD
ncbi:MAG TPA: protein kinase [Polyangia bacterium]|nr:protein kinase [Polyangia bacterium]